MCGGTCARRSNSPPPRGLSPRVRGNRPLDRLGGIGTGSIPACAGEPGSSVTSPAPARVYPRVCGGTGDRFYIYNREEGLSPRVRGNPRTGAAPEGYIGSIPACAGEPPPAHQSGGHAGVYPRVCGGTWMRLVAPLLDTGLSPRVRGNHGGAGIVLAAERSIPACAGEPRFRFGADWNCRVYPRVCGGTSISQWRRNRAQGLSPRVRGNPICSGRAPAPAGSIPACAGEPTAAISRPACLKVYPRVCGGTLREMDDLAERQGLSPRVRGNRAPLLKQNIWARSIPACAGEPQSQPDLNINFVVYPRVCGGTAVHRQPLHSYQGLSPRVRGNRIRPHPQLRGVGSIPACAGEPSARPTIPLRPKVYPRVCGGTHRYPSGSPRSKGLSPRVRGNRDSAAVQHCGIRSIPACAGEPAHPAPPASHPRVYPRVCGGTRYRYRRFIGRKGLSPRVRGNPRPDVVVHRHIGSIPACAGEPPPAESPDPHPGVYPRVCGGTRRLRRPCNRLRSLSPRVRGNRVQRPARQHPGRSIPACAGEPTSSG